MYAVADGALKKRYHSRPGWCLEISPHGEEFLAAIVANLIARTAGKFAKRVGNDVAGRSDNAVWIAVGAAQRLGNDPVDDAERLEVLGGDLHVCRCFLGPGGIAPE